MNLALNKKVAVALDRGLAGIETSDIRLDQERGKTYYDVFAYPGVHEGREWELLVPVEVGEDSVSVDDCCIHATKPGMGDYSQVSMIADAVGNGVPAKVVEQAKELARTIQGLDLPLLALSDPAKVLLDMLERIVEADAEGDDDGLREAMAAARESVVAYRPWIAANLQEAPGGTGRAPR